MRLISLAFFLIATIAPTQAAMTIQERNSFQIWFFAIVIGAIIIARLLFMAKQQAEARERAKAELKKRAEKQARENAEEEARRAYHLRRIQQEREEQKKRDRAEARRQKKATIEYEKALKDGERNRQRQEAEKRRAKAALSHDLKRDLE